MNITLYGTRGSIPVASKETRKYGGNTTCLYIESTQDDAIIVDAGSGIRELSAYCLKNKKQDLTLIFTHYHWDHMQGLPFFAPLYLKGTTITIYGPDKEVTPDKALFHQMMRPYFPTVSWRDVPSSILYKKATLKFRVGSITIQTIPTNHPNYTIGLKFTEGKNSFAFLTDNELLARNHITPYKKFVDFVKNTNFIIHDAAYTEEIYKTRLGWGHSTYTQVMQLAIDAGVDHVIFTHHDPPTTDQAIDTILRDFRKKYPRKTIEAAADGKTINFK
ncbi:MBL fold metallo-hydrolase [candidate division WOR-3 bacterium]|nr:MBL fold metallo-hydrolase [candidate division WOR-3 bacterium]